MRTPKLKRMEREVVRIARSIGFLVVTIVLSFSFIVAVWEAWWVSAGSTVSAPLLGYVVFVQAVYRGTGHYNIPRYRQNDYGA